MANCLTIVLNDRKTLSELCGANDANLRVIEDLIDEKVFSRGNEIFIESEDTSKRELFRSIIDQLKAHTMMGHTPSPDLIHALYNSNHKGEEEKEKIMQDLTVRIPSSDVKIYPRSYHQALYVEKMGTRDIVFAIGPAGTGKTYLAIAHALKEILTKSKRKLILYGGLPNPIREFQMTIFPLPGKVIWYLKKADGTAWEEMDFLLTKLCSKVKHSYVFLMYIIPICDTKMYGLRQVNPMR